MGHLHLQVSNQKCFHGEILRKRNCDVINVIFNNVGNADYVFTSVRHVIFDTSMFTF